MNERKGCGSFLGPFGRFFTRSPGTSDIPDTIVYKSKEGIDVEMPAEYSGIEGTRALADAIARVAKTGESFRGNYDSGTDSFKKSK